MLNPPKLIGHRGVKNLSPENTLESIKLAHELGFKWVEIDVKVSKDLVPILLHDDTLDRTTNGTGIPIEINYIDLKKLDAGMFFYNTPTKINIPTLKDILSFCTNNNIGINIELKPNLGYEKKNVEAIASLVNNFKNPFYFSSFDLNSLILMKELLPNSFYGILIDEFDQNFSLENILKILDKYNFHCCGFNKNIITLEVVNLMKNKNIVTTVYSEKNLSPTEANELWSIGVKSIFIDDPSEFKLI